MTGIIIKVLVGVVLFVGSLVGGLAATGRLNHEGTANIPVLNSFFPAPEPAAGEGHGDAVDGAHAVPGGETAADAVGEAGHAEPSEAAVGEQDPDAPRRRKVGRSVVAPEEESDGGGHGGGHGDEVGHEADGHAGEQQPPAPGAAAGHDAQPNAGHGEQGQAAKSPVERDFDELEALLQSQGRTSYEPGAFFRFQGMPAGLTPEQLNEAWQRVQGILRTIEQREQTLDLRQKELQELADDISRRWKELGQERLEIEQMQRQLDNKIARFERTVRLVRDDEVQKLKRNAVTLASFERDKAAELVQQQWQTERGQDEILRLLEFMEADAVNEILAELPPAMVTDVLEKRMTVSREAKPSKGRS